MPANIFFSLSFRFCAAHLISDSSALGDRMNNSSYVGYGSWNDERFSAAVKEGSSLHVRPNMEKL